MAAKEGKVFEQDFKKSFSTDIYVKRIKDDTSGFSGVKNECDYIVFANSKLYLLELKTTKSTTSFALSNVTDYQLKKLSELAQIDGVQAGFVINFRALEGNPTYYISATDVIKYVQDTGRKSIAISYLKENAIEIDSTIKRVRYTYNTKKMLEEVGQK